MNNTAKLLQWSYMAALGFLLILALLHVVKPEIAPSWNFISEYEVGRLGWLMQLAFLTLALSCISLVRALWRPLNLAGKIGLIMFALSAIGMLIAAVFKTDALNTPIELQTQAGKLHQLGAMLDQIPFATILVTIALFRKKEWTLNKPLLVIAMLLVWFGFVYFVGSVRAYFPADGKFGPHVPVGWQNRLMIVTQALWLAIVARMVRSLFLPFK